MVLMDGGPHSGVLSHGVPNLEFLSGGDKLLGESLSNATLHEDPCAIGADLWWCSGDEVVVCEGGSEGNRGVLCSWEVMVRR